MHSLRLKQVLPQPVAAVESAHDRQTFMILSRTLSSVAAADIYPLSCNERNDVAADGAADCQTRRVYW